MTLPPGARYSIGIDTGGTYTDAAVVEMSSRLVVATAKALTTKGNLSIGVAEALSLALAGVAPADVALVSLSTTLATNAIVEGHGSAIGVILIGFDDGMAKRAEIEAALPGARILRCDGGHDHAGRETRELDVAAVSRFLDDTAAVVDAYAVAAHWSVRNASHEERARELIAATGRPVSLSSDLAHALDAPRRALTAALNARIVHRIALLIEAVRDAMAGHGVAAPLLVVKGDGTLASAAAVALRPVETILSGPAASVIGARFLSGLDDLVVSDVGGTTTDIAVVERGWPRLDRHGAMVGGRRTLVRAIDVRTFGLGGDSEVVSQGAGRVVLSAGRVAPLSLLAARHPGVLDTMRRALADPTGESHADRFVLRPFGQRDEPGVAGLSQTELGILDSVREGPAPLARIASSPSRQRMLRRLVEAGALIVAAFTPSDAAHILGMQGQWSREGAVLGALLLERRIRMARPRGDEETDAAARRFAEEVLDAAVRKSGRVLIESLAGGPPEGEVGDGIVEAAVSGEGRFRHLSVNLRPAAPLVAVGGPAPILYPELGRRLGCEIVLPPHGEVANAVGAAVGVVKAQAIVDISSEGGLYRVHGGGTPVTVDDPTRALALATDLARERALELAAERGGGRDRHVDVHVDRVDLPGLGGDAALIAATIVAECWAPPA
ncbi:hydantoinase/oxoprolinase family protein [Alsobacter sp. SYSU M60028]|uniref:Hydantoinase/oxoprolinase family protein n=1 Tax=Alsobacter ponti TaxID=2962936 RepID=A0ABT1LJ05_9HYPH|nr:hydantoinase/oxoprolinase family protein [Alsobacter ponti]MCP8940203.1 hydantoinase/oxoprolinase family protein [Alsobacter ponti]